MTTPTRTADFAASIDRALHHVDPPRGVPALTIFADTTIAPPSLVLPVPRVIDSPADGPVPGTVPNTVYDPWAPLQHVPNAPPPAPSRPSDTGEGHGSLDADLTAAQVATVARSRAKLDRARSYADRLGTHAAEIRAKLATASERQVAAAIGKAEPDPADVGPLRGEAVEVERQHRQALAILADVEAEHTRHEADLASLCGSDGTARTKLKDAHSSRALAQAAADDAKAILDRATAHAEAVNRKLTAARSDEARHDADATARLRVALANGDAVPTAGEAFVRSSPRIEDDLRHARAAVDKLAAEHAARAADLTAADLAVRGAVDGVLCAEAETVARELDAADARAMALRVRLHTYVSRRVGDYVTPEPGPTRKLPNGMFERVPGTLLAPPRTVPTTPTINRVMASAPPPPHQGTFSTNWTAETGAWDRYAAALAADPTAEPGFPDRPAVSPPPPVPFA